MRLKFLSYLWGMETQFQHKTLLNLDIFFVLILPMRNGNILMCINSISHRIVLILPMRNGNVSNKSLYFKLYMVLILPMRNGNLISFALATLSWISAFLSYLWGMETHIFLIWSIMLNSPFLSYLWGMETSQVRQTKKKRLLSSYPTYEEWKPYNKVIMVGRVSKGSYPTYEEWRTQLWRATEYRSHLFLSYLWGMETFLNEYKDIYIKFLSYLWGMETLQTRTVYLPGVSVLILPMRNGNPQP